MVATGRNRSNPWWLMWERRIITLTLRGLGGDGRRSVGGLINLSIYCLNCWFFLYVVNLFERKASGLHRRQSVPRTEWQVFGTWPTASEPAPVSFWRLLGELHARTVHSVITWMAEGWQSDPMTDRKAVRTWLTDWLADGMTDWPTDRLTDWLLGRPVSAQVLAGLVTTPQWWMIRPTSSASVCNEGVHEMHQCLRRSFQSSGHQCVCDNATMVDDKAHFKHQCLQRSFNHTWLPWNVASMKCMSVCDEAFNHLDINEFVTTPQWWMIRPTSNTSVCNEASITPGIHEMWHPWNAWVSAMKLSITWTSMSLWQRHNGGW